VFTLFLLNLLSLLQDFDRIVLDETLQVLIKSSRNETLVLSIWIRILVPNFPSTTAWDHTSDPSRHDIAEILLKVALKHQK
jgi:hypothetical protein